MKIKLYRQQFRGIVFHNIDRIDIFNKIYSTKAWYFIDGDYKPPMFDIINIPLASDAPKYIVSLGISKGKTTFRKIK